MKARPILFSAEMVKAILEGRKTQTRRVVNPLCKEFPIVKFERWIVPPLPQYPNDAPDPQYSDSGRPLWYSTEPDGTEREWASPYGEPGDLLWVRESYRFGQAPRDDEGQGVALYADNSYKCHPDLDSSREHWCREWKRRPSIFMPRWASRITLRVTSVRVERLQQIRDSDALAEGVTQVGSIDLAGITTGETVKSFAALWDSINKSRGFGWDTNPYVWVVEFTKEPQGHVHPEQSLPA